jgi:hypothetical protein
VFSVVSTPILKRRALLTYPPRCLSLRSQSTQQVSATAVHTYMRSQDQLRARGSKVKVFACAPGFAATYLQKNTAENGGVMGLGAMMRLAQSAADGALPMLECMCSKDLAPGALVVPAYKGLMGRVIGDGVMGPPAVVKPEALCTDSLSAKLLWERSEAAIGPFWP